jgi:hypothetical protein
MVGRHLLNHSPYCTRGRLHAQLLLAPKADSLGILALRLNQYSLAIVLLNDSKLDQPAIRNLALSKRLMVRRYAALIVLHPLMSWSHGMNPR